MKRIVVLLEPITVRINVINIPPSVSFDTLLIQLSAHGTKSKLYTGRAARLSQKQRDRLQTVTGTWRSRYTHAYQILHHMLFRSRFIFKLA